MSGVKYYIDVVPDTHANSMRITFAKLLKNQQILIKTVVVTALHFLHFPVDFDSVGGDELLAFSS